MTAGEHHDRSAQLITRPGRAWPGTWQDHGLVFPSEVGSPMELRNLNRHFARLRERAGMPTVRLHDLRHAVVTLLMELGVPLGRVGGTPRLEASLYSAAMIDARRRSELAGGVALGVVALAGIGFWIGRANPGSTAHPDVLHGTVVLVGGARPVNQFVVDLDAHAGSKGYGLGLVPWTNGAGNGVTVGDARPPCIAVGHHLTFGVVHVPHGGITTDQIVWIDCGGDTGG